MLNRYIGFDDKNKKKIHESSILSEDLSNIDLESPRNNWQKLLKNAKDLGAKKVTVKLESQYPYFRLKYNIKFEPNVEIEGYEKPFNETLQDAFFFSYICDYLKIENELEDKELTFLNWNDNHLSGLKFQGEDILIGKNYIIDSVNEEYIPKCLRGKDVNLSMDVKLKTRTQGDFYVYSEIKYIKEDGTYLLNKDVHKDVDSEDKWMDEEFEAFIPPHADHLFSFLKEVFEKHEN